MSDYRELTIDECIERILSVDKPLVVSHVRPDGDTVGTAAALVELYRILGREAKYACSDKIPQRLEFLLSGLTLAEECEYSERTPITVDVPSPEQLGSISKKLPIISLMIDHHEAATPFADYFTIRGASSAGEVLYIIAKRMQERGILKVTPALAYSLFAAISSDTGCFAFSNADDMTHIHAAELMRYGIDYADINHRLFYSKPREQIMAEGYVQSHIYTAADGRIAYSYIEKSVRDEMGIDQVHFETGIDMVRSLIGAEIAFIIKETDTKEFKCSLRSAGADVTVVAREFSGGGHKRAAGCTVSASSAPEAAEKIIAALKREYF